MANEGIGVRVVALEAIERRRRKSFSIGTVEGRTIPLKSGRIFPDGRFRGVKAFERWFRFGWVIFGHRGWTIWLHDFDMIGLVFFCGFLVRIGWLRSVVWDQHELPSEPWLCGRVKKAVLRLAYSCCDSIISANSTRKDYILSKFGDGIAANRFEVVQNFPPEWRSRHPSHTLPRDVENWLRGNRYVVTEGMAREERKVCEIIEAIASQSMYFLVVLGPLKVDQAKIEKIVGPKWKEKVLVTGLITQDEIYPILDNAEASLIFYDMGKPNLAYCAPNRFYHALCRGVPVIVGSNPSLRTHVNRVRNGVVIDGDGSNSTQIAGALEDLASNHTTYRKAAQGARRGYSFETQSTAILSALQAKGTGAGNRAIDSVADAPRETMGERSF